MNITVPYEANTSELIMKLGGAVHGVGGPPATLTCGDLVVGINDLGLIGTAVAAAGERTSDWTVSSDYVAPVLEQVLEIDAAGTVHDMGVQPASPSVSQRGRKSKGENIHAALGALADELKADGVKADESEK